MLKLLAGERSLNFKILLLPLLFLFVSCASGVKVSTKYCKAQGLWKKEAMGKSSKVITKSISGVGIKDVSMKKVLLDEGIKCEQLSSVKLEIKRSLWQALVSVIPGFSSQTIVFKIN